MRTDRIRCASAPAVVRLPVRAGYGVHRVSQHQALIAHRLQGVGGVRVPLVRHGRPDHKSDHTPLSSRGRADRPAFPLE